MIRCRPSRRRLPSDVGEVAGPVRRAGDAVPRWGDAGAGQGSGGTRLGGVEDLAGRLAGLTFTGLSRDQVTALLIETVAAWGTAEGWRVYRRAASVVTLPPPMERQHSVLDVALARPGEPPIVVEVDHTHRQRTVDKLLAEAEEGRIPFWVRWGPGPIAEPPLPIQLFAVAVTRHQGRFSRSTLAAPAHSATPVTGEAAALFPPAAAGTGPSAPEQSPAAGEAALLFPPAPDGTGPIVPDQLPAAEVDSSRADDGE